MNINRVIEREIRIIVSITSSNIFIKQGKWTGKKKNQIKQDRTKYKESKDIQKPNQLEKINGFVLVLNYADSF